MVTDAFANCKCMQIVTAEKNKKILKLSRYVLKSEIEWRANSFKISVKCIYTGKKRKSKETKYLISDYTII